MNRLELLLILLGLFILAIIVIRSKRFDNFVSTLMRGTKSETASELKADIEQTEITKKKIQKNLELEEKNIKSQRNILEKL